MESYKILIKKSAAGELAKISRKDLQKIVRRVRDLEQSPRPSGCRKLSGKDRYRLRQGDYRIVYTVDDSRRIVEVYKIGNRREIYS
ncbi:MAG: type II toxin-antitoxin system RelE/ParE family toxin [Acidobacteria bacterium]|nr:type II toxin-antitoxin system RelE/ParE family toxin [Acidobacteriota bacterium]